MEGFKKQIRGYDKNEVNVFLTKLNDNFAEVTAEQKARIEELKQINDKQNEELNFYRKKEKLIERTLTEATKKASETENELKTQYALEIERLKIFQAKWTNCYEELKQKYHFDKDASLMESLVISTKQSLIDRLASLNIVFRDIASEEEMQFSSESDRISRLQVEQADRLVNELKNQINEQKEEAELTDFSDKSLDELISEIGNIK